MPPVTTTSTSPARIIESAISTARIDDAHTLLIVSAGVSIGRPAPIAAWRAGAWPAPPCSTWPMITYCGSRGSTPDALERGPDRERAELGRLVAGEPAAELPERRADGADDDAASHAPTQRTKLGSGASRCANARRSRTIASTSSSVAELDRRCACSGSGSRRGPSARRRGPGGSRRRRCSVRARRRPRTRARSLRLGRVATSSSKTVRLQRRPARDRRRPRRARSCPPSCASPPGMSVARRDVDRDRDLRARARTRRSARRRAPTSSWTAATATTSTCAPPASATRRAASSATYAPSRLSSARETKRPFGSSTGAPCQTPASPTRTSAARLVAVARADVDVQVGVLGPRAVAQLLRPTRRRRRSRRRSSPSRVSSSTRWPTQHLRPRSRRSSRSESSPLSSMFVIAIPISSMWPTIASVGAPSPVRDARERRAERVAT